MPGGHAFGRDILERYRVGYASGGELIAYLRWRQLPLAAALRTGLIDYDGREVLAGRITFSEFRAGRAVWMIGRVLEIPDGEPLVTGPKYLGLPGDKPIFGWEEAALAFPGYLKRFTIAYYLQGLVPHAMPSDSVLSLIQGAFRESPTLPGSLLGLGVILVVFVTLAAWIVERREYVLEQ